VRYQIFYITLHYVFKHTTRILSFSASPA